MGWSLRWVRTWPFGPGLLQQFLIIACMTSSQIGEFTLVNFDFKGVGARGIQKPVAYRCSDVRCSDHGFGYKAVDGSQDHSLVHSLAGHDGPGCFECKMTDEHRKPAKHISFQFA